MFGSISVLGGDHDVYSALTDMPNYSIDVLKSTKFDSELYKDLLLTDEKMYGSIHKLFGSKGMDGMMNTIWLIICA
ncbi:MAG: hypothetical protein MK066_10625, partial [Crocinitomicaceae bacterium]|nr:hypothetical protein [Crocinitomicaceae bacterium]